jgi:hypothetical protein
MLSTWPLGKLPNWISAATRTRSGVGRGRWTSAISRNHTPALPAAAKAAVSAAQRQPVRKMASTITASITMLRGGNPRDEIASVSVSSHGG